MRKHERTGEHVWWSDGVNLADGEGAMALPARLIRFGPAGGSLKCDIFTHGRGSLTITGSELPRGFDVALDPSGVLTVSVRPLPDGVGVLSGVLELGFRRLRGEIIVLQSSEEAGPRKLNPASLSPFAATEPSVEGIVTGTVEVSASSPWRAIIYNSSESESNPGFRFTGGAEPYAWDSERDGNRPLDIETTGANPGSDIRRGVAVFSLKRIPGYRRALMLCQDPGL